MCEKDFSLGSFRLEDAAVEIILNPWNQCGPILMTIR